MFCGKCGTKIKDGDSFCTNCGAPVDDVNTKNNNNEFDIDFGDNESNATNLSYQINKARCVTEYSTDTIVDQMDTVTFGSYPQSDKTGNTKDPIEWIVLDKQDDKVLLLSKYILDCKCYNNETKDITWENSSLRQWLNNVFYNTAFNETEKNMIQNTYIDNSYSYVENGVILTYGGNNTSDNVFCLSVDEVKKYFYQDNMHTVNERLATKGTNYAKNVNNNGKKLYVDDKYEWYNGNSHFWLRSPGTAQYTAANVNSYGYPPRYGKDVVAAHNYGVRVALWVSY